MQKTYLYYTKVQAQAAPYIVKHETLEDQQKYEAQLDGVYFRKLDSGKLLEFTQVQGFKEMRALGKTKYYLIAPIRNDLQQKYALYICMERVWSGLWGNYDKLPEPIAKSADIEKLKDQANKTEIGVI
jgi:hypothetical protein